MNQYSAEQALWTHVRDKPPLGQLSVLLTGSARSIRKDSPIRVQGPRLP
jgi:hypothetical protein